MKKVLTTGVGLIGLSDLLLKNAEKEVELIGETHPYVERPKFPVVEERKKKKECTYHEYTRRPDEKLNSFIIQVWACRHCGRIL